MKTRILSTLLSSVFVGFCFLHYFSLRPLWGDEQMVLNSLRFFQGAELFRVLKDCQAFPRVHLIAIQALAQPFDYHVLALRFPAMVFMVAAFFLWKSIWKKSFNDPRLLILALLSFAASYRLSYFSAEFKPYACDVLIAGLFAWLVLGQLHNDRKAPSIRDYALSISLPALMFFSYIAPLVLAVYFWNLLIASFKRKKFIPVATVYLVSALICGIFLYQIDLQYSIGMSCLHSYWEGSFIGTNSLGDFLDQFGDGTKRLVTYWFGTTKGHMRAGVVFIPFFIYALLRYGFGSLRKNGWKIASVDSLAAVLFLELVVLGVLQKYPFLGGRVTLFFAPFAFYLILKGVNDLSKIHWPWLNGKHLRSALLSYYVLYCLVCLHNTLSIYLDLYYKSS